MGETYGPLLILAAAAIGCGFALRFSREQTLRHLGRLGRFGQECLAEITKETEAKARVAIIKWGVAGALGLAGVVTGGVVATKYAPFITANMSPTIYQMQVGESSVTESSFGFTIYDMDNAGIAVDTPSIQGFPMPQGAIDTAFVADSVVIRVSDLDVPSFVTARSGDHSAGNQMLAWSDGTARVVFAQFLVDPSTDATGTLCYSGCTRTAAAFTERSWQTTDTAVAGLPTIGLTTDKNGYHPVMSFATDSAWLTDSYPLPLATIEEVYALTGTSNLLADLGDTIPEQFRIYGDLNWTGSGTGVIAGHEVRNSPGFAQIFTNVNGSAVYNAVECRDWTNSASNYNDYRHAIGQSNNTNCRGGWTYYDIMSRNQRYAMMRHMQDSIAVEFMRRSFAYTFGELLYHPVDDVGGSCATQARQSGMAWAYYGSYVFTGDPSYQAEVNCRAVDLTRGAKTDDFGNESPIFGSSTEGEGRPMAYAIGMVQVAKLLRTTGKDWDTWLDSLVVWSTNGRGGGTPSYSGGIWALDESGSSCNPGTWSADARPTNSFMIALMAQALTNTAIVEDQDTFIVGTDTTIIHEIVAEVADTMSYRTQMWLGYTGGPREGSKWGFKNYTGSVGDCSDSDLWTRFAHGLMGTFSNIQYDDYYFDRSAAKLAEADSQLFKLVGDSVKTINHELAPWGWSETEDRPWQYGDRFRHMWVGTFGLRQCVTEGSCE